MSTQRSYVLATPLAAAVLVCLHVAGHAGEGAADVVVANPRGAPPRRRCACCGTCNRAGDGLDVAEVCGAITRMHQRNAREQEPDRGEIVSTPAVRPEKLSDANA